jgi:hypothetical protein
MAHEAGIEDVVVAVGQIKGGDVDGASRPWICRKSSHRHVLAVERESWWRRHDTVYQAHEQDVPGWFGGGKILLIGFEEGGTESFRGIVGDNEFCTKI